MADSFWQGQLAGLETTIFPDLTGKSPSVRRRLTGTHSDKRLLHLESSVHDKLTPSVGLAACAKVVSLYLGERDFCVDYLPSPHGSTNHTGTPWPIRIAFQESQSNSEVVSTLSDTLDAVKQHGPPSQEMLHRVLESTDAFTSDILMIEAGSTSQPGFIPNYYDKYSCIFEFDRPDAGNSHTPHVKLHCKKSLLNVDDFPHVLSAYQEALYLILESKSSPFCSWWKNDTSLEQSVSNTHPETADCRNELTVHTAFEKHAAERPNDTALDFLEDDLTRTSWTFSELNSLASSIARSLVDEHGVQCGDSVPICVSKSPAFYACVLGVLKAGGVFTPFAGSPPERKRFMLHELGAKVILCTSSEDTSWSASTSILNVSTLLQDYTQSTPKDNSCTKLHVQGSDLCYRMYTSGSTGRPKAVSLEHQHVVQTACVTRTLVPWKPQSRILQQAGVTFDMCYFETFFAWNTGIRLCSASDNLIYNNLTDVINAMNIDLLGLTPSVALTIDPKQVPNIRWMYCIGEALPQSLVNAWEGRLVNSYGPTEAAQMVTLFPVHRDVKSAVIGTPFKNTGFVVLQKDSLETVPILGVGELCIGGFQVARGYYKNPEKTERSFINRNGQRLYRTGDLVRMLGNHTFEFVGRVDDQVKVRGQRVELGEIDKALEESHSTIEQACTQILKVSDQSKSQLVAFLVVNNQNKSQEQQDIRKEVVAHLSDVLPSYMIPKLILFIDKIPLSPAGKIDKRALTCRLRESDQIVTATTSTASVPSRGIVEVLRQIYSTFCGVPPERIGLDTSIYQLGIDSISAIQIAHRLQSEGLSVQPSNVLNYPSISQLSRLINDTPVTQEDPDTKHTFTFDFGAFDGAHRSKILQRCKLSGTRVATIRPASSLQTGMIMQSTQVSESLYFNHLTYRLPKQIDLQRFSEAWDAVVSKHEILRSGFAPIDDPNYPIAMITYHARSISMPVHHDYETSEKLDHWRSQFVQSAIRSLHIPPWKVLVSERLNEFYLSAHHALYDAQVLEILIGDLALAYDGVRLPPCQPIDSYITHLLGTREQCESSADFWQKHGKSAIASKFPSLNPLVEKKWQKLQVVTSASPLPLSQLEQGCRKSGISMQSAAQAAWGLLLGALSGENIVTFGTVLSGRVIENSDELSFPMITTVPTVVNCEDIPVDLVRRLMKFNADVQDHQFVPLNKIQHLMGYRGEMLFDTIFTFQKRSSSQAKTDTEFDFLNNDLTVEYPVSVELEPTEAGELEFSIFYESSYMRHEQADMMADQYHFLLQRIIFDSSSRPSLNISNADPRLFSIVPAKHEFLPCEHTLLHHTVEIAASKNPEKIALEFVTELEVRNLERRYWTFKQLDEEGNRIAHFLRQRQVKQGGLIAICFDKCPEAAFTMLGISKAGCGFLALDPGAPNERKKFIMEDSQASLLLTDGKFAKSLTSSLSRPDIIVNIELTDLSGFASDSVQLDRHIDTQEPAYCLYTSGTTGTPKGCIVTHENVIQVFACFEKLYAHTEHSRWLQFASYHFDVSVMEHFWSWFVGITVVKASRDLILQDLPLAISSLQISHIDLTPSLARLLDPKDVATLANGVFVTGGEMLRRDIIEAWGDSGAIHNAYGPTEATIGVTMYRHVPKNGRPTNIGWPFPIVGVLVVHLSDPNLPVLRGAVGELLVTGKLVAKGYLRRHELTQQRFIDVDGHKCYRTGDLARILSDGSIEILGRADDQVKLRGQRLETGEINSVIKQRDHNIDDVSTLVLRHPKQQKEQLVSFVAVREAENETSELTLCTTGQAVELIQKLRLACNDKLPGYMVPTHILLINKMPLSANNKVEDRQLRALYENADLNVLQDLMTDQSAVGSNQPHEKDLHEVCTVLSESLDIDANDISPSSNFFELGLDSISVITFSRSLKAAGYKQASPSLIMKNASISRLAAALGSAKAHARDVSIQSALQRIAACKHRHKALATSLLSIPHEEIETIIPCTALQAGMISRSLQSSSGLYFTAFNFELNQGIDLGKLRSACQRVCDNVQVLRTKFLPSEDGYIQVVLRRAKIAWTELRADSDDASTRVLQKAYQTWWKSNSNEIQQPFELLVTVTPTRWILTLHIFHALYDGNSLPLIMDAVVNEYYDIQVHAYGPSFSDTLPYGPLREVKGAEDFWKQHLSTLGEGTSHNLKPLSTSKRRGDSCVTHRIEPIQGLEDCRRKLNVTHQAMMQACWSVLIQDIMSGSLVIGLIVSGRSIEFEGIDEVIGPLFNTIPFLLVLNKQDTWRSVIAKCHDFNTAVLSYQHTPLRDIQRWTRSHRGNNSLFETLFVFQKELDRDGRQEPPWASLDETFEADYPLAFEVEQTRDGGFNLTLACQSHMSDLQASRDLLRRFDDMLTLMVDNVDTPLIKVTQNDICLEQPSHEAPTNGNANGSKEANGNSVSNGNGHTARNGNGAIHLASTNGNGSTALSEATRTLRGEIATLAEVDPDDVHGNTSIFEVGLDSIDAVKLSSRLRKATGVQLPVSKIMRLLTLDKIGNAIDDQQTSTQQKDNSYDLESLSQGIRQSLQDTGVNLSNVEKVLPCTPLQEGMIADMRNSNFERYLNFDVLKIEGKTDVTALKTAWRKVVDLYPILRSRFADVTDPKVDCTIAQLVLRSSDFNFEDVVSPEEDGFSKIFSAIREDVRRTFDDRPALRLVFVKRQASTAPTHLVLSLAHAMYDGWSLGLVHNTVDRLYHEDSVQVSNYEPALSRILNSLGESSRQYWRDQLADTKATIVLKQRSNRSAVHRGQRLSRSLWRDISSFCKHHKTTVAALCQSVWSIVLAHRTKQLDVSYVQVLSGRTDETTNDVVFPTMNTVISRVVIHGKRFEMVQYVQETLSTMSEHQHFPLRKAMSLASKRHSKDILNTLFIFQKSVSDSQNDKRQLYNSVDSASNVEYPICVEAEVDGQRLIWRTACEDSFINSGETDALLDDLDNVLEAMIDRPERPVIESSDAGIQLCDLPPIIISAQSMVSENPHADQPKGEDADEDNEWSSLEQTIRGVIADVAKLDVSEVDKNSSLFGLGLDSISTIKVSSLLRRQGFRISVNDLLAAGTIPKIAERRDNDSNSVNNATSTQSNTESNGRIESVDVEVQRKLLADIDTAEILDANNISPSDVEQILPTTPGQVLLLSRWQNEGVYYSSLDFSAYGCQGIESLRSAWLELCKRSPMLRTIFLASNSHQCPIVQVTLKTPPAQFVEAAAESSIQYKASTNGHTVSSTAIAPCTLIAKEVADGDFQLVLKISHALYDGFSLKMLISAFQELVNNRRNAPETPKPAFSTYLANVASTTSKQQFWTDYLSGLQVSPLPQRKSNQDHSSTIKQIHVVRANVLNKLSTIREHARKNQVSIQSLLLASYSVTHAHMLQRSRPNHDQQISDVLIGIFMANRNTDSADDLEAPTLGFAPVRVRNPLTRPLVAIAADIQTDMREISKGGRGQVGLWELQQWIGEHVKVDVWVNILRQWLPDQSTESNTGGGDVQIVTGEKSEDVERVYDVTRRDEDREHGLLLKGNLVRGCYDYAMMDLEATVKEDNLDIGIQAPTTLLDFDGARRVIEDVAARLDALA